MTDAILSALQSIADPTYIGAMLLGTVIGFTIGIVPGLAGVVGLSIALPFLFGVDPVIGLAMLIGLSAVTDTTGSFSSILIGVPGSSGSTATVLDGYPMARKGEGARALGASFSASMMGGVFGGVALLVVILAARPLVQALGSPELFMLTVLGMATVGVIVSGDALLGLASTTVGLMLGLIGIAPATAQYRYTFGELYLYNGLSIVVVALGIFAVPEVVALLTSRTRISSTEKLQGSVWDGFKESLRHRGLVLRSSILGTVAGAVPGLGGSVVDEMAYAAARATSRNAGGFGRGDVRGVIAPESANNSKEGGALMPTLILGIPGSNSTAILLGALVLMGLTPGPTMISKNLDITLTVVWTLVVANIFATSLALLSSRWVARVTLVPGRLLAPLLLVVFFGSGYQTSRHFGDIIAIVVLGVLGYLMKSTGWPRVPLLLGFVLSVSLERYLHISMSRYGFSWLTHPGVLAIGAVVLLVVVGVPLFQRLRRSKGGHAERVFV